MTVDVLINYSNAIIAIANVILIVFIFCQIRDQRKPIITIKIINTEKDVSDKPNVLEFGALYLVISNISNNQASDLKINYELNWDSGKIKMRNSLDYLNSGEATRELVPLSEIIKKYPELFEEKIEGRAHKKIPKKTLIISLNVEVSYNPLLHDFFHKIKDTSYKIKDTYEIEWGSLKNYPRFEDHPTIKCWNTRNNLYIYKVDESVKTTDLKRGN